MARRRGGVQQDRQLRRSASSLAPSTNPQAARSVSVTTPATHTATTETANAAASTTWFSVAATGAARIIGVVVAQVTVVAACLSYFGWVRQRALYEYFGVNSSALGLSTIDYLQNTPSFAIPMLIYVGLIGLVVLGTATWVTGPLTRHSRLSGLVITMLIVVGLAGCVLGLLAIQGCNVLHAAKPLQPLELGIGLLMLIAAAELASRTFRRAPVCPFTGTCDLQRCEPSDASDRPREAVSCDNVRPPVNGHAPVLSPTAMASTLVVIASTVAWSWSLYAEFSGIDGARNIEATLGQRQAVAVYSVDRLAFTGSGIKPIDLTTAKSLYKVRYDGLRLLTVAANGDLFLLPKNWSKGRDPVIVIRPGDTIRLDLVAAPPSSPQPAHQP